MAPADRKANAAAAVRADRVFGVMGVFLLKASCARVQCRSQGNGRHQGRGTPSMARPGQATVPAVRSNVKLCVRFLCLRSGMQWLCMPCTGLPRWRSCLCSKAKKRRQSRLLNCRHAAERLNARAATQWKAPGLCFWQGPLRASQSAGVGCRRRCFCAGVCAMSRLPGPCHSGPQGFCLALVWWACCVVCLRPRHRPRHRPRLPLWPQRGRLRPKWPWCFQR